MGGEDIKPRSISRRTALKLGGLGLALGAVHVIDHSTGLAFARVKPALAAGSLPDIQFDLSRYVGPVVYFDGDGNEVESADAGLPFQFGPRHTKIVTYAFARIEKADGQGSANSWVNPARQREFTSMLNEIEKAYEFGPDGIITVVSYGMTYFKALELYKPGLMARYMPRLRSDSTRYAFEDAQAAPTDVTSSKRPYDRPRFNVPVKFADYHITLVFRSDSESYIDDVIDWIDGSDSLRGKKVKSPVHFPKMVEETTFRHFVSEPGWPRRTAAANNLPYASLIHPNSPMWMGFADQHVGAAAPPELVTFKGNSRARLTTAEAGDYFDNGCVQHISSNILDLEEFYGSGYVERAKLMFRANELPSQIDPSNAYANGIGPAYVDNDYLGASDAARSAAQGYIGHTTGLQQASRLTDGTPLHIRLDGPGFDTLDTEKVSDTRYKNKALPKLHFAIFVPTAALFAEMRSKQAAPDLVTAHSIDKRRNGVEFFINATRRQNMLVPPRRHRSFPLMEFLD